MIGLAYLLYELVFFCIWIWVIITIIRKVRRRSDDLKKYQSKNETGRQNAGQNVRMSGNNGMNNSMNNSHNHTYQHKVQPVDEASVIKRHAEKQEELARKRAEREAMYNEGTGRDAGSVNYGYGSGEIVGKNGDAGDMPRDNERTVKCKYCGANNILPKYRTQVEKCYFCRLEVE